ncbi:MAG: glycosyltransferase [Thermoplasmatales archaeon]
MGSKNEVNFQISVIIMCFNRKKFILNAIKSVLQQTLDRNKYEIIVTKNFRDTEIDSFILQNNISTIDEGDVSIGVMMSNAIKMASGRYVCFLDDDDFFYQNKLSKVLIETVKDPSITYYHNSFSAVDSDGVTILDFKHRHPNKRYTFGNEYGNFPIRQVKALSGDINMSSISVRRDLLLQNIQLIKDITGLQDVFLFYLSVLSRGTMVFDPEVLTGYRIHMSESHSNLADLDKYSAGARALLLKYLNSYEILLAGSNSRILELKYEYLTNKCRYQLMVPRKNRILIKRELFFLLIHFRLSDDYKNQIALVILGLLYHLMPERIAKLYVQRKMIIDRSSYSKVDPGL